MKKTVGILLDPDVFRKVKKGKTGHEKISLYNRAAKNLGLTPIYLSLEHLTSSKSWAYGYKYVGGKYVYGKYRIPSVIHNRAMPVSLRQKSQLKKLKRASTVFNAVNRHSKYHIHKLLRKQFSTHLPHTISYSLPHLQKMMKQHSSIFIKPQSGSVGKGIMKLSRSKGSKWKLNLPSTTINASRASAIKKVNAIASKQKYLIQETIPLAKYKGRPFDLRVTVQRGGTGAWQVTGMIGKVARKGRHVTNVARGGSIKKSTSLFKNCGLNPQVARQAIEQLSLDITRHLGTRLPHLADAGLDIGISTNGTPYFIELNCRDQRYGFKESKMHNTFYRSYETPIRYAKFLMEQR